MTHHLESMLNLLRRIRADRWLVVLFFLSVSLASYRLGFSTRGPIDEEPYFLLGVSPMATFCLVSSRSKAV